jgi:hypothetical protein
MGNNQTRFKIVRTKMKQQIGQNETTPKVKDENHI